MCRPLRRSRPTSWPAYGVIVGYAEDQQQLWRKMENNSDRLCWDKVILLAQIINNCLFLLTAECSYYLRACVRPCMCACVWQHIGRGKNEETSSVQGSTSCVIRGCGVFLFPQSHVSLNQRVQLGNGKRRHLIPCLQLNKHTTSGWIKNWWYTEHRFWRQHKLFCLDCIICFFSEI